MSPCWYRRKLRKINAFSSLPAVDFFNRALAYPHSRGMTKMQGTLAALIASIAGCSPGGGSSIDLMGQPEALRLECAAGSGTNDSDEWLCPESLEVECGELATTALVVQSPSDLVCDVSALELSDEGPLTLGTHRVVVRNALDEALCASEVVVVRSRELRLVPRQLALWPPNHKLHEISVADCVDIIGACPGEELDAYFVWASSDEPVDAKGDGNHAPDILLSDDCQHVALRSERQGPSDGRVYTLGVRVLDAAGDAYETACTVAVDHDQSGREAVAGDDAYRIAFDGTTAGIPGCVDYGR